MVGDGDDQREVVGRQRRRSGLLRAGRVARVAAVCGNARREKSRRRMVVFDAGKVVELVPGVWQGHSGEDLNLKQAVLKNAKILKNMDSILNFSYI